MPRREKGPIEQKMGPRRSTFSAAAELYARAAGERGLQIEAMLYSLGAALRVLAATEEPGDLAPLHHLFASVSRLAAGHHDDVLQPLRVNGQSGKPGPDGALLFKQVHVLMAAEILFRGHGGRYGARKRADEETSQLCAELRLPGGHLRPISADMVRNWRSQSGPEKHSVLRDLFRPRLAQIKDQWSPEEASEGARALLEAAASHPGIQPSANAPSYVDD